MNESIAKDKFELELDTQIDILQACQKQKGANSCLNCAEIFSCQTRKNYVDAVYNSMAKGKAEGGFDF